MYLQNHLKALELPIWLTDKLDSLDTHLNSNPIQFSLYVTWFEWYFSVGFAEQS